MFCMKKKLNVKWLLLAGYGMYLCSERELKVDKLCETSLNALFTYVNVCILDDDSEIVCGWRVTETKKFLTW